MDHNTVDSSKLFSVKDMIVVITGGGTGIGLMMTKAFANNGAAKVYIIGRRKEKLDEAAKTASLHNNIIPIVGDVTSKDSLLAVAGRVQQEAGYVNLLICNSGMMPPGLNTQPGSVSLEEFADKALEQKTEDWNSAYATNSTAVAFTSFAFLKLLDAGNRKGNAPGRKSQILVTTSIAAFLRNPNNFAVYGSSKAAATHLVKHLSGTLGAYSIRVNAIAPGLFPSDLAAPLLKRMGTDKDPSVEGACEKDFVPAERLGSTADMAGTVLYMASAAAAYMNGCINVLDGGRMGILPGTY